LLIDLATIPVVSLSDERGPGCELACKNVNVRCALVELRKAADEELGAMSAFEIKADILLRGNTDYS
jgi:hypothetical protein